MNAMMILLLAGGTLMHVATTHAADFPDVEQLPPRNELPDPLRMLDGTPVKSPQDWQQKRRPELIALFEHYMYGAAPEGPEPWEVNATVESEHEMLGGKAKMKQVKLRIQPSGSEKHLDINLLLFTPTAKPQAPVFVGLSFGGNHTVFPDPRIKLPTAWMPSRLPGVVDNRATDAARGSSTRWPIEMIIDRGYAVATAYHGDIDPDQHDWSDGVHPLYYKPGQTEPGPHEWGTIAAWAWGLSRMADYLEADGDVDAKRMIVIGHSRNGKTALLAGALDERFAIVIPSQAGCGGTAPSRSTVGESVERINTSFPHWFNDTFPRFNQQTDKLPFDQHGLMALVAPRPLLLTNATGDQWANPAGQFEMLKAAEPVYRLLGVEGCGASEMPPENELMNTRLGYFIRPGKHDMTEVEWTQWLTFADKHLPKR